MMKLCILGREKKKFLSSDYGGVVVGLYIWHD